MAIPRCGVSGIWRCGVLLFALCGAAGELFAQAVDRYGDPLPQGAVARFGSVRYRNARGGQGPVFLPGTDNVVMLSSTGVGIWDVTSGLRVREVGDAPASMFAVSTDGKLVATISATYDRATREYDTQLVIWDIVTGKQTQKMQWRDSTSAAVRHLLFSPDAATLVTGGEDGKVRFWDLASGEEILNYQMAENRIQGLAFSPDGQLIVATHRKGAAIWRWLVDPKPGSLTFGRRGANAVVFSPDGKFFATASDERNGVRVWDAKSRDLIWQLDDGGTWTRARQLAFTPDSRTLAIPGDKVHFHDARTGKLVEHVGTGEPGYAVAYSTDRQWFCLQYGKSFRVWNTHTGVGLHEKYPGNEAPTQSPHHLRFTSDGKRLIVGGLRGSIRTWETETSKFIGRWDHDNTGAVVAMAVSPDDTLVATSSFDYTVRLWSLPQDKQVFQLFGHARLGAYRNHAACFTPDSKRFLTFGSDFSLRVWDVKTGKALREWTLRPSGLDTDTAQRDPDAMMEGPLGGAQFSADSKYLVLLINRSYYCFRTSDGAEHARLDPTDSLPVTELQSAGDYIVNCELINNGRDAADRKQVLRLRDVATLKVVREIPLAKKFFFGLAISSDAKFIAARLYDQGPDGRPTNYHLSLFDTFTGEVVARLPDVKPSRMAFTPDNRQLATVLSDSTIVLFDIDPFRLPK